MTEPEEQGMDATIEPVAVGPGAPGHGAAAANGGGTPVPAAGALDGATGSDGATGGEASLLALVDRLAGVLERSELGELEVSAGSTTIILRSPAAVERPVAVAALADAGSAAGAGSAPAGAGSQGTAGSTAGPSAGSAAGAETAARPSVKAPLTGIYYGAPSPGATPYVAVGDQVAVGQIIGLIEAMKLFNEIKSDLAGRVVRICADNGALVKAKQPLIEVEPL